MSMNCSATNLKRDQFLLLYKLRKIIEKWFLAQDAREEIMYQIENTVTLILLDGIISKKERQLVNDLCLLNLCALQQEPSMSTRSAKFSDYHSQKEIVIGTIREWVAMNLRKLTLCSKLKLVVSDKKLLRNYYSSEAILCKKTSTNILFMCVSSIEQNNSSLLTQIDSLLPKEKPMLRHRRSNSHPQFSVVPIPTKTSLSKSKSFVICNEENSGSRVIDSSDVIWSKKNQFSFNHSNCCFNSKIKCLENNLYDNTQIVGSCKSCILNCTWHSLPDLQKNSFYTKLNKTISQPINISTNDNLCLLKSDSRDNVVNASKSSGISDLVPIHVLKCDDIKIYFDQSYTKNMNENEKNINVHSSNCNSTMHFDSSLEYLKSGSSSTPIHFLSCISTNLFTSDEDLSKAFNALHSNRRSDLTNDFMTSLLPQEGEKYKTSLYQECMFDHHLTDKTFNMDYSLSSDAEHNLSKFLQTLQFSRNNTELERENAHFKISDAIIAMVEYIKWVRLEKQLTEKEMETTVKVLAADNHNNEPGKSTNIESTLNLINNIDTKEDINDKSFNNSFGKCGNYSTISEKRSVENYRSQEDHIAYAEWGETNLNTFSAEGVALSLITKFSDTQLPKPSDLTWLVSEKDAPQELLSVPESLVANPDDQYVQPFTRGTRDWAPPRQQIIFTDHPSPNRKNHLQKQKYRCAGCGMKVLAIYAHRFRYCTYLGKYLCTGCHRNQISVIPALVLTKWDFSYYPVCVFAYRLLEQMWTYPLFYIPDLNPGLYSKIKKLHTGKLLRIQLKYIQDFIRSCRFADKEKKMFDNLPVHLTEDPDNWAMSDFIAVRHGRLQKFILELISKAEEHVFGCMLCTARAFICELCSNDKVIYPWQSKIKRCCNCGSCFHEKCWKIVLDCVKCQRLKKRKQTS